MKKQHKNQKGFLLLTSVIIISAVLLIIITGTGFFALQARSNSLVFNLKEQSYFQARSCLEHARYQLSEDFGYLGNETITFGEDSCTILPIVYEDKMGKPKKKGNLTRIESTANVEGAYTHLLLRLDSSLAPIYFEELP